MNIDFIEQELESARELISQELLKEVERQPYEVKCADCGEDLQIEKRTMDYDGDLVVTVFPCSSCKETKDA